MTGAAPGNTKGNPKGFSSPFVPLLLLPFSLPPCSSSPRRFSYLLPLLHISLLCSCGYGTHTKCPLCVLWPLSSIVCMYVCIVCTYVYIVGVSKHALASTRVCVRRGISVFTQASKKEKQKSIICVRMHACAHTCIFVHTQPHVFMQACICVYAQACPKPSIGGLGAGSSSRSAILGPAAAAPGTGTTAVAALAFLRCGSLGGVLLGVGWEGHGRVGGK